MVIAQVVKPNWHPTQLTHMHIYLEFMATLGQLGFGLSLPDVRTPQQNYDLANRYHDPATFDPYVWHQDGYGGSHPPPIGLVAWSNGPPTRVRDVNSKEEIMTYPFDIVLIYNARAEHAMPPSVGMIQNRWLARDFYYTREEMGVWMPCHKGDQ